MICDECETAAHCSKHGCIPKQPAHPLKTVIEMAREAGLGEMGRRTGFVFFQPGMDGLKHFAELVRADERSSWPAEMEAMERQVNILTDALAEEREACWRLCDALWIEGKDAHDCREAIRARGKP